MAEELTEEQKKEKSKQIDELITSYALEEKHNKLVDLVKSNFILTTIMVGGAI